MEFYVSAGPGTEAVLRDELCELGFKSARLNSGGIPFTGIINNSNIARETTAADVLSTVDYAKEVGRLSGLPVVCTTVEERLFDELKDKISPLFGLQLQAKLI